MSFSLAFSYCFIIQITVTAPTASLLGIWYEIVKHDLSLKNRLTFLIFSRVKTRLYRLKIHIFCFAFQKVKAEK